jgi:hypothetical protein
MEKPYVRMQQALDDSPIAPAFKPDPRTAVLTVVKLPKHATEEVEEEATATLTAVKANKPLPTPEEIAAALSPSRPVKASPVAEEVSVNHTTTKPIIPSPTTEAEASLAPANTPSAPQE